MQGISVTFPFRGRQFFEEASWEGEKTRRVGEHGDWGGRKSPRIAQINADLGGDIGDGRDLWLVFSGEDSFSVRGARVVR